MLLTGRAGMTIWLALASLCFIACPRNELPPQPRVKNLASGPQSTPTPAPLAVAFNGERALEHVRKQIEIGPRPPGSPELAKTREYIIKEFTSAGVAGGYG